jgi:hypothetical protein
MYLLGKPQMFASGQHLPFTVIVAERLTFFGAAESFSLGKA